MRHVTMAASLFSAATITVAHAHGQYGMDYGHEHMWGGWAGMIIGPVMMIVVIAAVVAAIVLLVRWLGGGTASRGIGGGRRSALDILEERFAKGEIDKAEFEERRRALEG